MNLRKEELVRLKKILSLQAESYEKGQQVDLAMDALALVDEETILIEEDEVGNYYITKGEADLYPCVVAHLDQVHDRHDNYKIHRQGDILFAFNGKKQVGIGGDDKCGVFLAIEMLLKYENVKVVLFQDEEIGCIGSGKCDITFFSDCAFILQGDRNHYTNDFITYTNSIDVCSKDFIAAAKPIYEKYGYSEATGSVTDVGKLTLNKVGVSCVNLACGYLNAHTDNETVSLSKLALCLRLFEDLFDNMSYKKWDHIGTKYEFSYSNYYKDKGKGKNNDEDWDWDWGKGKSWNKGTSKHDPIFEDEEDDTYLEIDDEVLEGIECDNCGYDGLIEYGDEHYCPMCFRTEHIESNTIIYNGQNLEI